MLCLIQTENKYWKSTAVPDTKFMINLVLDIQMRIIVFVQKDFIFA